MKFKLGIFIYSERDNCRTNEIRNGIFSIWTNFFRIKGFSISVSPEPLKIYEIYFCRGEGKLWMQSEKFCRTSAAAKFSSELEFDSEPSSLRRAARGDGT